MSQQDRGQITPEQYDYLLNPLRSTRVAQRKLGNKQFSYLESWDVRAHLTRIFGFGNFDAEVLEAKFLDQYAYEAVYKKGTAQEERKPMIEVMWQVTFRLVVRDQGGNEIARYVETAVGSATKGQDGAGLGDIHDNAVKSATSDALKRCAINLGTQFGLSLYNDGQTSDVVRVTLIKPADWKSKNDPATETKAQDQIDASLNQQVQPSGEAGNEGGLSDEDVSHDMDTPDQGVHQNDGA